MWAFRKFIAIKKFVLVSLTDDQVIAGELSKLSADGVTLTQVSIMESGEKVPIPLPEPRTVFVPMHRVTLVQYLAGPFSE